MRKNEFYILTSLSLNQNHCVKELYCVIKDMFTCQYSSFKLKCFLPLQIVFHGDIVCCPWTAQIHC
jgi:hypothetical protein